MKKILAFIISFFILFGLNGFTYGNEETIENIKNQIKHLKEEFEKSNDVGEKADINDKLSPLLDKFFSLKGIEIDRQLKKYKGDYNIKRPGYNPLYNLETGDVLVFKFKEKPKYHNFFGGWDHAEVAYDHKTLLDIKGYNDVSTKHPLSYVTDSIRNNEFETIAILKMNFNSSEKESFKSYIDRKLLGKPYSVFPQIASKLQPIAYYCSLLVRKAHVDSGREVDIDYDWGFIVRPVDLILSDHVQEIKFIHY